MIGSIVASVAPRDGTPRMNVTSKTVHRRVRLQRLHRATLDHRADIIQAGQAVALTWRRLNASGAPVSNLATVTVTAFGEQ